MSSRAKLEVGKVREQKSMFTSHAPVGHRSELSKIFHLANPRSAHKRGSGEGEEEQKYILVVFGLVHLQQRRQDVVDELLDAGVERGVALFIIARISSTSHYHEVPIDQRKLTVEPGCHSCGSLSS